MSKLSFRARALDASKPMPIFMAEEVPDLPEYSAINRAVPQMPSGMEKEEESEHHLQRAICAGLIIPTPEVQNMADSEIYERMYPSNYKAPRQLIHVQPFSMEQDIPDYDMDSEDEQWIKAQSKKLELTPLKFEEMLDRLEKSSGQTVINVQEAKSLLKEDDDLAIAVYDYWLEKRLKTKWPLIPTVKTELRAGAAANNPYLAFRRRTEKMQTRKNRKNDETSYEKMLKLRRDLSRAVTLLEMVKRREKTKRELLHLTVEVYEKRYQAGDFSGQLLADVSALKSYQHPRPAFAPIFPNQYSISSWTNKVPIKDEVVTRKEKRPYKRRKPKAGTSVCGSTTGAGSRGGLDVYLGAQGSSEEETSSTGMRTSSPVQPAPEAEEEDEGPYAFRRNPACNYHAPLPGDFGNWPWCSKEEGGAGDHRYRFCLTSVSRPKRQCIGFARRRIGRGGRIILDRESTELDDIWRSLDFTVQDSSQCNVASSSTTNNNNNEILNEMKTELHFRPKMSPKQEKEDSDVDDTLNDDVADQSLLARRGPVTLQVQSEAPGSDTCTFSTLMELDLDRLDSDDLFPTLGSLSTLNQDYMEDSSCLVGKSNEPLPVPDQKMDWDLENGVVSDIVSPSKKRLGVTELLSRPVSSDSSTLSSLLTRKGDKDGLKSEKQRTGVCFVKDGSELNGPSQDVTICGKNGDIRSCSPTQVGCSAFFMCDSNNGGLPQSNGESSPRKSASVTRLNPPPPYPSTSLTQCLTGNGSWNHIDVGSKNSGPVVVVNHSDGLSSRVQRPTGTSTSTPTVILSNGPLPSATSAECLRSLSGIRTSASNDLNRKIALVQRAATATPPLPSVVTVPPLQPSCSTSGSPATVIRQVNVLPGTQNNSPNRENSIPSEEKPEDVCADTNQLMRKTNSLPMEVT
ncbi:Enhancer of polycomb-like protein 1 [Frankliniella fusca]|uniref:Enhancer of polycomb-like protein n=1 Tax=Frankliniella fusca TaxID=407009 RepID=A0AAE1L8R9_9NEOP|nr:Enhancer of polycomb-like protein 1 [Frankliniella fusca]